MPKKSNKLFRDTIKEHLKKAQKENPKVDLILADGNPRSERDMHEDMYKIGDLDDGNEEIERSLEPLIESDLKELFSGSMKRLKEYFILGNGRKWGTLYNIEEPLFAALCQGAAMHYHDKVNGIKDFDIWYFYPFNKTHLPYRTIWNWDYKNPKFGREPLNSGYTGRRVDVLVRSIKNSILEDPINSIHQFLLSGKTTSSRELAKKAVVMLYPESLLGKVIWYKKKI